MAADVRFTVVTLSDQRFEIETDSRATVDDLKKEMEKRTGVPADQYRLLHKGVELESGKTLADYHITTSSHVLLIFKLKGGGEPFINVYERALRLFAFQLILVQEFGSSRMRFG